MKVDYKTITINLRDIIKTANVKVFVGNPDVIPITANEFPCVVISLDNKKEEITHLGANRRQIEIVYKLFVLTRYINYEKTLNDLLELVDNIEEILRNNLTINNSVNYHNLETTEFGIAAKENTFLLGAIITLKAIKQIQ
ncbi:MAG: hypothetical protein QXJ14_03500 [Candidatus Aenigmatarchaeota archaeon]